MVSAGCRVIAEESGAVVVGRVTGVAARVYSVVKSDVGLSIVLVAYSFFGAVLLHHAEHDRQLQLHRQLDTHRPVA